MLSKELEYTLNSAFRDARDKRHEFLTVEHLLLALLDVPSVYNMLRSLGLDTDDLRTELVQFIDDTTPQLGEGEEDDVQPTLGFQRVLQRAVLHVQSSGRKEVTGENVLVAVFAEKESQAVYLLHRSGVTRLDVVNFISHGLPQVPVEDVDALAAAIREMAGNGEMRARMGAAARGKVEELRLPSVLAIWNDVLQLSDAQCDSRSAFGEAKDAFQ